MTRSIRLLGAALGALTGLGLARPAGLLLGSPQGDFGLTSSGALLLAPWLVAWVVVGLALLPYLTLVPAGRLFRGAQEMSTAEFIAAVVGLLLGLLMGLLLGFPLARLPAPWGTLLPVGVSLFLGLGMVGLTVAKRQDLLGVVETIGLVRRPRDAAAAQAAAAQAAADQGAQPTIVVDTSAIIDGRIADIADSGFLYGTLVVPRFVLEELQHIADSSDALRRNRGRRGLEILNRMQRDSPTRVEIVEDDAPGIPEVDGKLIALAKTRGRAILTNDFNLNRVAELQGIRVLNINSLANAVKPAVLPGEELRVRVIHEGKEAGQGVGFLDDGTMIVVEGGSRFIDRDLDVAVTRVLQTVAGRMIFAHPRVD